MGKVINNFGCGWEFDDDRIESFDIVGHISAVQGHAEVCAEMDLKDGTKYRIRYGNNMVPTVEEVIADAEEWLKNLPIENTDSTDQK